MKVIWETHLLSYLHIPHKRHVSSDQECIGDIGRAMKVPRGSAWCLDEGLRRSWKFWVTLHPPENERLETWKYPLGKGETSTQTTDFLGSSR